MNIIVVIKVTYSIGDFRNVFKLTRSLREPGGPCTKSMEVSKSRMERVNGYFFCLRPVISHFIQMLLSMWFLLLVSTLHTLLVATSYKPRTSFAVVNLEQPFVNWVCMKFEYITKVPYYESGARKKVHFLSIGANYMALPCMSMKYRHKKQHTHNEPACSPIEQKCHLKWNEIFIQGNPFTGISGLPWGPG